MSDAESLASEVDSQRQPVPPICVFKIGGSLLSLAEFPQRLVEVIRRRGDYRPLLVAGGGPAADIVREWDRTHSLGEEQAHWLALKSLQLNEEFLLRLLPKSVIVSTLDDAMSAWDCGSVPIMNTFEFVRNREPASRHILPHRWDVTSDSIAAWVALEFDAAELVLLKSADLSAGSSFLNNGREPHGIDAYFSELFPKLRCVSWVNLRSPQASC